MNKPKTPIGMVVMQMRGSLADIKHDYFKLKLIWNEWESNKLYWALHKNYGINQKPLDGIDGAMTTKDVVESWLERGYEVERRFRDLIESVKFTAQH